MTWFQFFWTDYRLDKLAQHGVLPEEAEEIVMYPELTDISKRSGRPTAAGYTTTGKRLYVVYDYIDDVTIEIITAYEV